MYGRFLLAEILQGLLVVVWCAPPRMLPVRPAAGARARCTTLRSAQRTWTVHSAARSFLRNIAAPTGGNRLASTRDQN